MTRSVTTREPEWDMEQRDLMLALSVYRDGLCPCGCGGRSDDTLDPDNTDRYVVDPPTRCHRRTALTRAQKLYEDTPQPGALLFSAQLGEPS